MFFVEVFSFSLVFCRKSRKTRKSVDCVVVEVLGAVVSVSTKGQMAIAQSSAEAELGGAHRAALMGVCVQNTWLELFDENLPIGLLMDSAAGKIMAVRRGKGKVRHLEVKQLYLQELTNALRVKTYKAKGEENKADIGTKPMTTRVLQKFYGWLCIEQGDCSTEVVVDERMIDEKMVAGVSGFDVGLLRKVLGGAVLASLLGACTGQTPDDDDQPQCDLPVQRTGGDWLLSALLACSILHALHDLFCAYQWCSIRARPSFSTTSGAQALLPAQTSNSTQTTLPDTPCDLDRDPTRRLVSTMRNVYVSRAGACYHSQSACRSLRDNPDIQAKRACRHCWPATD